MKKWSLITILLTVLLVLAACGSKEESTTEAKNSSGNEESKEVTVKHELGETKVKQNPEKVVVFDFGVLDTLDELGVEVAGVPQATIPPYLEKYSSSDYTNVGSLKEADFEAISSMKPDVIFISARQSEMYEEFAKIAPTVYVQTDYTNYMESFTNNMETIAEIFDKEDEMKKELEDVQAEVDSIKEKTGGLDSKVLILMGNEGEVSAYGPGSRFGILHDVFGFKPSDENIEESTHGQNVTFEYVLEQNPDVLFVIDRDAAFDPNASVKDSIENELVQKTNAYKKEKIVYLNGGPWYLSGGGLQSMKQMVEDAKAGL
ncbi:siderophore ABC transporter substrate-binding protein [Rossellomorea aquimaris]|uniref:Siderophore ABC transporter substrate-binding protein n=1 Tax=Rossellomorea aquimaris TaxID=189382 RepID=A0A5D4UL54_9BACI|nr:siderophore ABC transporter substrate-binding protein [Rossellomorea aquimaris]TYS81469.1 siderophore ABC transporter substrate-binding protein [Rossellomorea aquimaris]TYS88092.1 siderophore ABC transporter substrate-binding protein [Rossellomorea aquimaris]